MAAKSVAHGVCPVRSRQRVRIGLTLGDLNGIGPELSLAAADAVRMGDFPDTDLVLVGCARILAQQARALGRFCPVTWQPSREAGPPFPVTVWDPAPDARLRWVPGKLRASASRAACDWIDLAVEACLDGRLDALVTAPISKEGLHRAGIPFSGHTERIAARAGVGRFGMLLAGGPLRVLLATRHIALRDVPGALTFDTVSEAIDLAGEALPWLGLPGGVIGVCGLNPHAGEGGALGEEERLVIRPAIEAARRRGWNVRGPLAGDSAFYRAARGEFALLVAMYHDQGLGPLKLVGFETGVNVTLGLPFVRTSPDHGTAFDLANRKLASPRSLLEAVRWARNLSLLPNPWSRAI